MYGPSARDCYNSCNADALNRYGSLVRGKVERIGWDSITAILTSRLGDIELVEDFYRIILVEPQPNDRASSRTRIVTKAVSQLLWERDSTEQW